MKILLANKFYYRRGGDCIYMLNLEQLLRAHGHEVAVFSMDYPENLDTPWKKYFPKRMSKIKAFTRPFGDGETRRKFSQLLEDFRPDVVHLNNIHTQLSPIIAELAHRYGCRVVWTLHDLKLLCPRYDCLRKKNGKMTNCELCFNGGKKACLNYNCIKGSKLASFIGYREAVKWNRERLENCTDVFVCPSQFMADKMVQGGFAKAKMKTICNFIDVEKCRASNTERTKNTETYYCFVGRLSHEKGTKTLIEAANGLPYKLVMIGDGPLMEELKAVANDNVEFVGFKQWEEIKHLVGKARFSVLPSELYENNPLSVIEAKCLGTPVLGADIGGIPELTQYTFESGNVEDLKEKIKQMWDATYDRHKLASESIARYDAESYYRQIMDIYSQK